MTRLVSSKAYIRYGRFHKRPYDIHRRLNGHQPSYFHNSKLEQEISRGHHRRAKERNGF